VGAFDGGVISSDGGALLLGATDKAIGLVRRFAACFSDARDANSIEHTVTTLVGQRLFAIALGYEDLNEHDELRHDPVMAVLTGKLRARRKRCAPVAEVDIVAPGECATGRSSLRPAALLQDQPRSRRHCRAVRDTVPGGALAATEAHHP
jgi:Transposase DDE domain group 1